MVARQLWSRVDVVDGTMISEQWVNDPRLDGLRQFCVHEPDKAVPVGDIHCRKCGALLGHGRL